MNAKKRAMCFALFGLVSLFILSNFVSAIRDVTNPVENFIQKILRVINPILEYTLGGANTSELFFVKVLLFILMLSVVYFAVARVPGINTNVGVTWVVSIVVSILATRFLSTDALINFVWLPSGVLGIALTCLFPLIIFFFFIEGFDSRFLRRTGWIFFTLVFFGLAYARWNELVEQGFNLGWIYILTALVSLLSFVFDKTIHAYFIRAAIEQKGAELNTLNVSSLQTQIQSWRAVMVNPASTNAQIDTANKQIKDLDKRLRGILKS